MTENKKTSFLGYLIPVYLVVWQIMAMYYWFDYSKHHSFWEGVIKGFFVGEFKGFFWIFNIW